MNLVRRVVAYVVAHMWWLWAGRRGLAIVLAIVAPPVAGCFFCTKQGVEDAVTITGLVIEALGVYVVFRGLIARLREHGEPTPLEWVGRWRSARPRWAETRTARLVESAGAAYGGSTATARGTSTDTTISEEERRLRELERQVRQLDGQVQGLRLEIAALDRRGAQLEADAEATRSQLRELAVGGVPEDMIGLALALIGMFYTTAAGWMATGMAWAGLVTP